MVDFGKLNGWNMLSYVVHDSMLIKNYLKIKM